MCVWGGEGKTQEVDVTLQTKKTRMDLSVFFILSVINQSGVVLQSSSCDPDVTLTL